MSGWKTLEAAMLGITAQVDSQPGTTLDSLLGGDIEKARDELLSDDMKYDITTCIQWLLISDNLTCNDFTNLLSYDSCVFSFLVWESSEIGVLTGYELMLTIVMFNVRLLHFILHPIPLPPCRIHTTILIHFQVSSSPA